MHFGISTHLYHGERLSRVHLEEVAASGFHTVELFATRTHFPYEDEAAIVELAGWLRDLRLTLHGVHAPIYESYVGGVWGRAYSTASADEDERRRAVAESLKALRIAKAIPYEFLVVHLGVLGGSPAESSGDAVRRSLDELRSAAEGTGVKLAVEVIPNRFSSAEALVRLIEDEVDGADIGICLDTGHAHIMGDVVDAIETVTGHLVTTHIDDNGKQADDHLVPFDGSIQWPAAITAFQKIGYEGVMLLEVANTTSPREVLERSRRARQRLEELVRLSAAHAIDFTE